MSDLVMVVDDSATIRMQVRRVLQEQDYEVMGAWDGQDAYDKLLAGCRPALIVCDVLMPRMNGIEFIERLRTDLELNIPVVMLTTEDQPHLVRKARGFGAKGWLVKPFKPDLFLSAIRRILDGGPAR